MNQLQAIHKLVIWKCDACISKCWFYIVLFSIYVTCTVIAAVMMGCIKWKPENTG